MKKSRSFTLLLLLLLLLLACTLPVALNATVTTGKETKAVTPTATITEMPAPELTITPTSTESAFTGQCAWMWATEELPEITLRLNEAFQRAGLNDVEGRAAAYGENCMDSQSNKVMYFAAMQTDFYLTIPADTGDTQAMGEWIEKVLPVIEQFPPGQIPGPNPGYIGIRFTGTQGEQNLWFLRQKAQELAAGGTKGSALYDALLNP